MASTKERAQGYLLGQLHGDVQVPRDPYLSEKDYWRAIILFGSNTATYKIALAQSLASFVAVNQVDVRFEELADDFFHRYLARLIKYPNRPQLSHPHRLTVMERVVHKYQSDLISEDQAIEEVAQKGFSYVIPCFHTVNTTAVPISFYIANSAGISLTDAAFNVLMDPERVDLLSEMDSRWDLIEAAFMQKRESSQLANDIRQIYLNNGYERTNITNNIPTLNGYQKGICFYCGEAMEQKQIHVDHVIPRQLILHDEIWNLVLAHDFCNMQKSDSLPGAHYISKLIERNEYLIASNHPIRDKLIIDLGTTALARHRSIMTLYDRARNVIKYTWVGIHGYRPDLDPFYRNFVRSLKNR